MTEKATAKNHPMVTHLSRLWSRHSWWRFCRKWSCQARFPPRWTSKKEQNNRREEMRKEECREIVLHFVWTTRSCTDKNCLNIHSANKTITLAFSFLASTIARSSEGIWIVMRVSTIRDPAAKPRISMMSRGSDKLSAMLHLYLWAKAHKGVGVSHADLGSMHDVAKQRRSNYRRKRGEISKVMINLLALNVVIKTRWR